MLNVEVVVGDLCRVEADGICTSTNPHLALMIGTGGAVRDEGGWEIQEACSRLISDEYARSGKRFFLPGSAHLTTAGGLPYQGVIHCVASDAFHGTSRETIATCVRNALRIADARGWATLAMPLFGTGHAAFRVEDAAEAMAEALTGASTVTLERVVVIARMQAHVEVMRAAVERHRVPAAVV